LDVERINQFDIYTLGQRLKALAHLNGDADVEGRAAFNALMIARSTLASLLRGNPTPLGVSRTTAQQLHDQVEQLFDNNFQVDGEDGKKVLKWPDESTTIPAWHWQWMCQALERFETVFQEDMREAAAYVVPKRGIYSIPSLVDNADATFPAEVIGFIPNKAKTDFRAAGRCLAFNLLTASGYHVGRAVEGMLEAYYQFFCGKGPADTLNGWRDYIIALEKVRASKAFPEDHLSEKTLKELDQMREDYRNPLAHPRVVLDESDARVLFSNGESVIICMAGELRKAVEAKAATSGSAATTLLTAIRP
jgi:hypothetical protein